MTNAVKKRSLDWYLKWFATSLIILSVTFRMSGIEYRIFDLAFGTIGTLSWLIVAIFWKDRSLIVLNSVMLIMLGSTFIREL